MSTPWLLGIEIGGTKLQVVLGTGDGRIAAHSRFPAQTERGAGGIWAQITGAATRLLADSGVASRQVGAAGVGFGGPVDAEAGTVVRSHQVSGWEGAPVVDWVRRDLGIARVALQNDADTAALAEARLGAGRGASPTLYVNSGSGVGGGLVVDGRVYRGGSGIGALEIGHLLVHVEPGNGGAGWKPLEAVASGWAIGREAALRVEALELAPDSRSSVLLSLCEGEVSKITAEMVANAARSGDQLARGVLDTATSAFAEALAHSVTLLAPRVIVLGGGVSLIDRSLWLDPIRAKLAARVFPPYRNTYEVVPAALGENVVVQGALLLASDVAPTFGD